VGRIGRVAAAGFTGFIAFSLLNGSVPRGILRERTPAGEVPVKDALVVFDDGHGGLHRTRTSASGRFEFLTSPFHGAKAKLLVCAPGHPPMVFDGAPVAWLRPEYSFTPVERPSPYYEAFTRTRGWRAELPPECRPEVDPQEVVSPHPAAEPAAEPDFAS
jgi:hypothetical protein